MEELYAEGLATHGDPSHASTTREGVAKRLQGHVQAGLLSREIVTIGAPLRRFFGRAAKPIPAISAAMVFSLTVQPASCRSAVITGDPRLPLCSSNSRLTSAFSRSRRARRGERSPSFHL